ncbi:uncharacterized protein [Clytia hemisphaerica]|uniref:uncharacterized protein n=1 Tax=Clytia hemisphaerica TaxID=252671 RepID=UPI0034D73731
MHYFIDKEPLAPTKRRDVNIIELIFPSDLLPSNICIESGENSEDKISENIKGRSIEAIVKTGQSSESMTEINQSDGRLETLNQSKASGLNLNQSEDSKAKTSQSSIFDVTTTDKSDETVLKLDHFKIISSNQSNQTVSNPNQSEETEILNSQSEETKLLNSQSEETEILNSQSEETKLLNSQSEETKLFNSQSEETKLLNSQSEETKLFNSQSEETKLLNSQSEETEILNSQSEETEILNSQSEETEILNIPSEAEMITSVHQSEEILLNFSLSNGKESAENQIQPGSENATHEEIKVAPTHVTPEYLTAQCIIVCQSHPECISLISELETYFQDNNSIVLQHMANGNQSKQEILEPQRILVILMSLDTFLQIKPHSIECVLFNARVNDLRMYETVKSILLRMNPLKVVHVKCHENEVYSQHLWNALSKEYLAPPFSKDHRSLYRLCGMYSSSMYSKVDVEVERKPDIESESGSQTLIYMPMRSTIKAIAKSDPSVSETDESALRHAIKLLKENRELDNKGDVLKRIEAPSNCQEMKEFFVPRIMDEKEELTEPIKSLCHGQPLYVYRMRFAEMTSREGDVSTSFKGINTVGLISTIKIPKFEETFYDHYGSVNVVLTDDFQTILTEDDFQIVQNFKRDIFKNIYNLLPNDDSLVSTKYAIVMLHPNEDSLDFEIMHQTTAYFDSLIKDVDTRKIFTNTLPVAETIILAVHTLPKISAPMLVQKLPQNTAHKSVLDEFPDQEKAPTFLAYFNSKYDVNILESESMVPVKHLKTVLNSINTIDYAKRRKSKSKPNELPQSLCYLYPFSFPIWRIICVFPSLVYYLKQYENAKSVLSILNEFKLIQEKYEENLSRCSPLDLCAKDSGVVSDIHPEHLIVSKGTELVKDKSFQNDSSISEEAVFAVTNESKFENQENIQSIGILSNGATSPLAEQNQMNLFLSDNQTLEDSCPAIEELKSIFEDTNEPAQYSSNIHPVPDNQSHDICNGKTTLGNVAMTEIPGIDDLSSWSNFDENGCHQTPIQDIVDSSENPDLVNRVRKALISNSATENISNEIFEYFGDSVLKYVITINLFLTRPDFNENSLNFFKSQLVSNELLYRIGLSRQLRRFLFYDRFEPSDLKSYMFNDVTSVSQTETSESSASQIGSIDEELTTTNSSHFESKLFPINQSNNTATSVSQIESNDSGNHSNKAISDMTEALIGALFTQNHDVNPLWLNFLEWLGYKLTNFRRLLSTGHYQSSPCDVPSGNSTLSYSQQYSSFVHPDILGHVNKALTQPPPPSYLTTGLHQLEESLGYKFKNKLLPIEGQCHASFAGRLNPWTNSNQRLEFIGDAILELMVTSELIRRNEKDSLSFDQGSLSNIRSAIVCTRTLAVVAARLQLHGGLKILDLPTKILIDDFVEALEGLGTKFDEDFYEANVIKAPSDDRFAGAILEIPKDLADCTEAVIGAVYLDTGGNLQETWSIFEPHFADVIDFYVTRSPPSIYIYVSHKFL